MKSSECSFCYEFRKSNKSYFEEIYGLTLKNRIIDKENPFVAVPTIGQLFKGSILILPQYHIERMADIKDKEYISLKKLVDRITTKLSCLGKLILYEHGAKKITRGGCGIYHAHICIVPLPSKVTKEDFHFMADKFSNNLYDAFKVVKNWDQYLLFRDTSGIYWYKEINNENANEYPSQYFRKKISDKFELGKSWDWRQYGKEKNLLETVNYFLN